MAAAPSLFTDGYIGAVRSGKESKKGSKFKFKVKETATKQARLKGQSITYCIPLIPKLISFQPAKPKP
jgi:hypothetical protein